MSFDFKVWYISDFTKEILQQLKIQYQIEMVSIHMNTINNWFIKMEEQKIHFIHRDKYDQKIYNEIDLDIACYLYIETKINEQSIGVALHFVSNNVKVRSYEESKLSIFQNNKETHDISNFLNETPSNDDKPKHLVDKVNTNSELVVMSVELTELLKKDITFSGRPLTTKQKQRMFDFLAGLV